MKKITRIMALLLSVLMMLPCFFAGASAQETETKEFSIINYNVAGLPNFGSIFGNEGVDVKDNQRQLGAILNDTGYDIIAVQEDFGSHRYLAKGLTNYAYQTNHTGGIPGGDGMNCFSKYKIFNETRIPWNDTYGIAEGDELTPKGILYAVVELEDGVYLDLYNIHADAFDGAESIAARESNFRQLAELILSNSLNADRPVIVTGDFNTYSSLPAETNSHMYYYFHELCGFKDAWTEIHNNGDYHNFDAWHGQGGNWGCWDSVEKFLYKSGGGVEIEVTDYEYVRFYNSDGISFSDHAAATAKFTYTKTEDFIENKQELTAVKASPLKLVLNVIKTVIVDLYKVFTNFDEILGLLKK